MDIICREEQCTRCGACIAVCNAKAIEVRDLAHRVKKIVIDENKCTSCQRCVKTCPNNNIVQKSSPQKVYAAISHNTEALKNSASGGVAYELASCVIKSGGVVFGAVLHQNHAVYKRAVTCEDLELFRGSKYVASDLNGCYSEILSDLKDGKEVLFIGLPCQVAGIKNTVPSQYHSKLILIDLICHGVPEPEMLNDHIQKRYGKDSEIKRFRNEKGDFWFRICFNKKTKDIPFNADLYMYGFLNSLCYRENCYHCQYACIERVGDITLGDFWGLKTSKLPNNNRVSNSLILVNSIKGKTLFDKQCNNIDFEERDISDAIEKNAQLTHASQKSAEYLKFRELYKRYGFEKAAMKTWGRKVIYNYLRWSISCFLKK